MKGGTGLRLRSFVVTSLTTNVCCFASATISLRLRFVADQNLSLLQILIETAGLDRLLADFKQTRVERRRQFAARDSRRSSSIQF